jgi:hypothetical protein
LEGSDSNACFDWHSRGDHLPLAPKSAHKSFLTVAAAVYQSAPAALMLFGAPIVFRMPLVRTLELHGASVSARPRSTTAPFLSPRLGLPTSMRDSDKIPSASVRRNRAAK